MKDWQVVLVIGLFIALVVYVAFKAGQHFWCVLKKMREDPLEGIDLRR